ncbi:hypothetical protein HAHE_16660 [Haloferula helveola]|uniref:Secreted protein n=2 Tax=Haloferula helveola TaxID=490095 RepID=A0ABM7RJH4_9BACT|nr:hypothetical protein HAHE_16660 [Haloferula helveola]
MVRLACLLLASVPALAAEPAFLENDRIRIGVDLESGGSIFHFSEKPDGPNLLNHADRGRFIQQSYYGKPDGSKWVEKPWCWNPVQGGDYKGKPARVVEKKQTDDSLYVKSVPVNWAGGEDVEECRMEEWIFLDGPIATIRFRFVYKGEAIHPPKHQELPAVFVDSTLADLVYYKGDQPWTGAALTMDRPGWPNEPREANEEWAAWVGPDGRGIGVYFPGNPQLTTYRHPGKTGPKGGGCSYFAPVRTMQIKPGFEHDYTIHLTIGTAAEIRQRFGELRKAGD